VHRNCSICGLDGVYKCQDCLAQPLFCTACCRVLHQLTPFHSIRQWTGTFFQQSCLADAGLIIHLGHDATGCAAADDGWDIFDGDEAEDEIDPEDNPSMPGPRYKLRGAEMLIVDTSGVHRLQIRCCQCPAAERPDVQLFRAGLFPASFINPKTVFTFAVLDDFLLDNLECGTSAMNYYSKLRRTTSSAFPHLVPVTIHDAFPV